MPDSCRSRAGGTSRGFITPLAMIGSAVRSRSHATSRHVTDGSRSAPAIEWIGLLKSTRLPGAKFAAETSAGSWKRLRMLRSRLPAAGVPTVTTMALKPARSARATSALVTSRSLKM